MQVILAGLLWFCLHRRCIGMLEENLTHLKEVLTRLRQAGLRLKAKKCMFLREEVSYLGHCVTPQEIKPDPVKTEKIRHYPAPADVSQVWQFLRLASYYWRFVPEFNIAAPLQFQWSPDCSESFGNPKEALMNAYPHFNTTNPFKPGNGTSHSFPFAYAITEL